MSDGLVRKALSMSPELAAKVDDIRFDRRFKTDAEVLRYLIEAGLKAETEKQVANASA